MSDKARYPHDIASFITSNKTFAVEAHFARETETSPLKVFHDTFSRFVFTIIDKSKAVKSAKCNVKFDSLASIKAKTEYAFKKYMDAKYEDTDASSDNPAFNVRFTTGNLKGKTPADVLIENGEKGKEMLKNQYSWLKENLAKYPKNKELMDAISASAKLSPEELKATKPTGKVITILDITTRPLTRNVRESDGKCFCYEAKVEYVPGNRYPIYVKVTNYYAKVVTTDAGLLNVQASSKDSEIANDFYMTFEDWLHCVEQLDETKENFRRLYFAESHKLSEQMSKEDRANALGRSA